MVLLHTIVVVKNKKKLCVSYYTDPFQFMLQSGHKTPDMAVTIDPNKLNVIIYDLHVCRYFGKLNWKY